MLWTLAFVVINHVNPSGCTPLKAFIQCHHHLHKVKLDTNKKFQGWTWNQFELSQKSFWPSQVVLLIIKANALFVPLCTNMFLASSKTLFPNRTALKFIITLMASLATTSTLSLHSPQRLIATHCSSDVLLLLWKTRMSSPLTASLFLH